MESHGKLLTKNGIKGIIKGIKSLENRGIYWKEILERLKIKKEDFSIIFLVQQEKLAGLAPAAAATDAAIQKKIYGSSLTALIIPNEEIVDTMKIVDLLKN